MVWVGVTDQVDWVRAGGAATPLSTRRFVKGAMGTLSLPPRSFVVVVHACNEARRCSSAAATCPHVSLYDARHSCWQANRVALDLARSVGAGYAAMPCCVRAGLYAVSTRHVDDDARHAAMVRGAPRPARLIFGGKAGADAVWHGGRWAWWRARTART